MTYEEEKEIDRKLTNEAFSHIDRALDKLNRVVMHYYGTGRSFNIIKKDYLALNKLYIKMEQSAWSKHK